MTIKSKILTAYVLLIIAILVLGGTALYVSNYAESLSQVVSETTIENTDPSMISGLGTQNESIIILVMTIFLLALATFTFVTLNRVVREPIEKIKDTAQQINSGDLSARVDIDNEDELAHLAGSINTMATELAGALDSTSFLNGILNSVPGSILVLDADLNITYINPAAEGLLGFSSEQLSGQHISTVFGKGNPLTHHGYDELLATEGMKQVDGYVVNRGNRKIDVKFSSSPLRKDDGQVEAIICSIVEITDYKKIENELRSSNQELENQIQQRTDELTTANETLQKEIEEREKAEHSLTESQDRLNVLVDHSYDMVIETSSLGNFLYVSQNHDEKLGYKPKELIGTNIFQYVHPDDQAEVMKIFSSSLISFDSGHVEFRYRHKNQTWRWLESTGKPFRTASGEVRAVVTSRDITDKKIMEEEAQKHAKLESLGIMAGGLAHDFNNLLTTILGNISLARTYEHNKEVDKILTDAESASIHARSLTQQLLTFAKGGVPIKTTSNVKDMLQESMEFVLRGSNVKSELMIPDDIKPVEVDQGQMNQVLNNLIINAKQAMPKGGIIRVNAENITLDGNNTMGLEQGDFIRVSFEDEGEGISEENLQKIFDPYFTTKAEGSGLGLATTYSIVNQHGGKITVDSTEGEGTRFDLYMPASDQQWVLPVEKLSVDLKGDGKILVLDDEESIRKFLDKTLCALGYTVDCVDRGSDAITRYKESVENGLPYDAVILDLTIPGEKGGEEVIRELVTFDKNVTAIVSSGYSNNPVMSDYEKYGFKDYLTKPYTVEDLGQVLRKVINERVQN